MADSFIQSFKKEYTPKLQSLIDDIRNSRDKDYFKPYGLNVFSGKQGSGKTITAVRTAINIKIDYPKSIFVSNLILNELEPVHIDSLKTKYQQYNRQKQYIYFETHQQLHDALTKINNKHYGVIYLIDEFHTYFNSLQSKDIPIEIFTEISQQRKQRKLILATSQIFMRMAKPFREQCNNIIMCNTRYGIITTQKIYSGDEIDMDYNGNLIGTIKKTGRFYQTRRLRNAFDTYQKIQSSSVQTEMPAKEQIPEKKSRLSRKR